MIWLGYILTVLAITGLAALKAGKIDLLFLQISAISAILLLIPFYFTSRANMQPTKTEAFLAGAWIIVRRLVGILGFLMFSLVCFFGIDQFLQKGFSLSGFAVIIFGLFLGFFILWKCWYGEGASKSFTDDRPSHEARKKRYNWK